MQYSAEESALVKCILSHIDKHQHVSVVLATIIRDVLKKTNKIYNKPLICIGATNLLLYYYNSLRYPDDGLDYDQTCWCFLMFF